jgi:hypothetical protein
MNKIISYSLYGTNKRYTINALVNLELCKKFYPDWKVYLHYDVSVPSVIIKELQKFDNCILIEKTGIHHGRMWWRLLGYDYGDIFISRDIDSHVTEREVDAVEEWLNSSKHLHIMRDHSGHNKKIQGGMFGIKKSERLLSMKDIIGNRIYLHQNYGDDEEFLSTTIYSMFLGDMMVHDSHPRPWELDKTNDWRKPILGEQFIGTPQFVDWPWINKDLVEKYKELY